jgi:eukaryotic-like serine/threonine-protein kinase
MRRNRVAFAAIGSVALALIAGAVVSAEQALRAERAERRATEERAHAEDLLEFMLGDLRAQLAKVGRLDVLESASDKVLAYFSAREAQGMDDAALGRYSKALTQIGEIRMDQERYADALAAFMTAYDRASALVNRHPRNGEMLFARGQAEYWNGMVHWKRGELALAADWLGRYFQTSGTLVALDATKPEWISELAYGNHNLAALNKQRGELTEARAGFLGELTTLQKMEAGSPGNIELRFRTADAHSWLGGIALQEGDFSQALHEYGLERAILEGLVLAEPRTARWQFHLADTGLFRTDILAVTGQGSNARDELARAQELLDHLVALDPGNRHWQAASLHSRLLEASLMKQKGDLAGSALLVSQVRPQLEKLYAAEPTDRVLGRWLAWALRLEAQAGSAAAADRAVETGKKLIEDGRATDDDLGECARGYLIKGELEENLGEAEAARHLWERADQLLAPRLPGTHDWRLLDPAARVARRLGRTEVANAIIAQLDRLGYVPLDPWPVANGLDVASPKGAQHLTEHPRNQTGNE